MVRGVQKHKGQTILHCSKANVRVASQNSELKSFFAIVIKERYFTTIILVLHIFGDISKKLNWI
jgi:hypothetical protein